MAELPKLSAHPVAGRVHVSPQRQPYDGGGNSTPKRGDMRGESSQ
jgi:hypothetical protein